MLRGIHARKLSDLRNSRMNELYYHILRFTNGNKSWHPRKDGTDGDKCDDYDENVQVGREIAQ